MRVVPVEAFDDNYMYIIHSGDSVLLVDPAEPEKLFGNPLIKKLDAVLTTHHHWDHAQGNLKVSKAFPDAKIIGGCQRVEAVTLVPEKDCTLAFGTLSVKCIYTPCHTSSHICYYIEDTNMSDDSVKKAVFTGDTLFISGCGKFFEGTADQMYNNLVVLLGSLPPETKVYCGHEYTVTNLKFCLSIEPDNEKIRRKLDWAIKMRVSGKFTVPSTIQDEKDCNVFMRVEHTWSNLGHNNAIECMEKLRDAKNCFRP